MTTKNTGRFAWFDLMTDNVDKAKTFYTELFNWKIQSMSIGDQSYEMFAAGEAAVGGIGKAEHPSLNNMWLAYTTVDNLDNTIKYLKQNGGNVLVPEVSLPSIGRWVIATDAQGIVFAPFQSANNQTATEKMGYPLGQFCWHELGTTDVAKATAFYTEAFGWEKGELNNCSGGGYYQVLQRNGQNFGGIGTFGPEVKPNWRHYVAVANVDETAARCKQLGGKVIWEPMDIGEQGRIAVLNDTQGAEIAIWAAK